MKDTIEKNELFKLDFGCKTPLGSWFFEFFDSKNMSFLWAFYWHWKNFHLIISSMWSQWTSNFELRNLSQSTSFVRPGMKVTVCGQLKLFNFEHKNVEFLDEIFVLNHPKIFRITEISIFNICTHWSSLSGELYFC